MKKRSIIISGVLLAMALGGCGTKTGNDVIDDTVEMIDEKLDPEPEEEQGPFREDIAGKIGEHIYYSYNVFEGRNLDEHEQADLIKELGDADDNLTEDVYITGWGFMSLENRIRFFGYQYLDGAVVHEVTYSTDLDHPGQQISIIDGHKVKDVDTSDVLDPQSLFSQVEGMAEAHSDMLCDYPSRGVYGDYLLVYDVTKDLLVYEFTINDYSRIVLDAESGEIVEEYYFDGAIPD